MGQSYQKPYIQRIQFTTIFLTFSNYEDTPTNIKRKISANENIKHQPTFFSTKTKRKVALSILIADAKTIIVHQKRRY